MEIVWRSMVTPPTAISDMFERPGMFLEISSEVTVVRRWRLLGRRSILFLTAENNSDNAATKNLDHNTLRARATLYTS